MAKTQKNFPQSVKGMHDILPADQPLWERARRQIKEEAEFYGFSRIDTPLLEQAGLFEATSGASSDLVQKQMYIFRSGNDRLALRVEGTAPAARAYIEHGMSHLPQPVKLYYLGPMFRHEQPQAGRYRQHHQAGFEILGGEPDPVFDAQIILVCCRLMENLKLDGLSIQINSIGCNVCRPIYRRRLSDYYRRREICQDCRRRLTVNPLRLLDCQKAQCQTLKKEAPAVLDSICPACSGHFKMVLEYLDELDLAYFLNQQLVRGLDYYNRTVFEIVIDEPAETAPEVVSGVAPTEEKGGRAGGLSLAGGGRYDYLLKTLGGEPAPGVGAAIGLERIIEVIKNKNISFSAKTRQKVFLIHIGDLAKKKSLSLIELLRRSGLEVTAPLSKESFNAQLRLADKAESRLVLIFGQKEAMSDAIIIRDLKTGTQETVMLKDMVEEIKKRL